MMIKAQDPVIKGQNHLILLERQRNKTNMMSEAQTRHEDPVASRWATGTRRTHWVLTPGPRTGFRRQRPGWGPAGWSHLKGDVVELAAAADGRSARVHHAVHRNHPRAAPRGSPGPFPAWTPRRGAAGGSFAFNSLLARHFTRFPNELLQKSAQNWSGKVVVAPTSGELEPRSSLLLG